MRAQHTDLGMAQSAAMARHFRKKSILDILTLSKDMGAPDSRTWGGTP